MSIFGPPLYTNSLFEEITLSINESALKYENLKSFLALKKIDLGNSAIYLTLPLFVLPAARKTINLLQT